PTGAIREEAVRNVTTANCPRLYRFVSRSDDEREHGPQPALPLLRSCEPLASLLGSVAGRASKVTGTAATLGVGGGVFGAHGRVAAGRPVRASLATRCRNAVEVVLRAAHRTLIAILRAGYAVFTELRLAHAVLVGARRAKTALAGVVMAKGATVRRYRGHGDTKDLHVFRIARGMMANGHLPPCLFGRGAGPASGKSALRRQNQKHSSEYKKSVHTSSSCCNTKRGK